MMLGVLGMLVANAATVLGASRLLERVRTGKPAVDFLLFLLLRALLISAAVLVAGLTQSLTPLGLGLAGAAALAALLASRTHPPLPRPGPPPWNRWLVLAATALVVKLLIQVWFFAPYSGDVVGYHLPKIAEWVRAGGFTRELGLNARVTLPAGFELLETWWVVFLRHDVLIEMAGVEMLLVGGAAVYALARELRAAPSGALGAALLFALTPGLQVEATSTLNDVAATAMTVATAALIVARADGFLLLLAVGLGTGIKPTVVYALPGLGLLAVLLRSEPMRKSPSRRTAGVLAVLGLAVGSAWYVRNLLWFGNPVYPMGTELGRQVQQLGPSLQSLRENLLTLVDIRIYDRFPVGALHQGNANWGAVVFACGLPALIAALRDDPLLRKLALAFAVSMVAILGLVTLDAWNMRFVLFVPALPAIAAARLAAQRRPVLVLVSAAGLLCGVVSLVPSEISPSTLGRLCRSGWRERTARPAAPSVEPGSPVGCAGEDLGFPYWLYGPDFSRRVVYLRETSSAGLLERLDREGIRTVYASPRTADTSTFQEAVAAGRLEAFRDGLGSGFRRVR